MVLFFQHQGPSDDPRPSAANRPASGDSAQGQERRRQEGPLPDQRNGQCGVEPGRQRQPNAQELPPAAAGHAGEHYEAVTHDSAGPVGQE